MSRVKVVVYLWELQKEVRQRVALAPALYYNTTYINITKSRPMSKCLTSDDTSPADPLYGVFGRQTEGSLEPLEWLSSCREPGTVAYLQA